MKKLIATIVAGSIIVGGGLVQATDDKPVDALEGATDDGQQKGMK